MALQYTNSLFASSIAISSIIFTVALAMTVLRWATAWKYKGLPLPPGPKPWPIIGNVLDIPKEDTWLVFKDWSNIYGDLIYLRLPQRSMLILGSAKAAFDLMEKRSNIYSDRPPAVMQDLMGWEWNIGEMPYGSMWRKHRRCFHQYFNQTAVENYRPLQIQESRKMLLSLLDDPNHIGEHLRRMSSATILNVVYGMEMDDIFDEYIEIAKMAVEAFSVARAFGAFWVEYLPFLRHIPAWMPGAKFHQVVAHYKPSIIAMRDKPFEAVKKAIAAGSVSPSVASTLLQNIKEQFGGTAKHAEEEEIARNITGVAYGGGADTTSAAMSAFILAMIKFPEVQRKAQEELDAHVGQGRLPDFADYDALTYVYAVFLETMRWIPVAPLGVPHSVTADDEYNGYRIPKGTSIVANLWAILHDPEEYPEPEEFRPERYIKHGKIDRNVRDPLTVAFGVGRRICVGRHLSNSSLWLNIACVLHVFDIGPPQDENGNPLPVHVERTPGLISHLEDTPCLVKPRSPAAEALIRESAL